MTTGVMRGGDCDVGSSLGLTGGIVNDSNASYGVQDEQRLHESVRRLRSSQNGVGDGNEGWEHANAATIDAWQNPV